MTDLNQRQNQTNQMLMPIQPTLANWDSSPLPDAVHHYTDAAGLLGIIDTGTIWATDYRFLNDSSELRYVFRLASSLAEETLRQQRHGPLGQAFLEYIATNSPPYTDTVYYLCCFSEVDNSLSQWRAYGGLQGFSLTFPGDITHAPGLTDVPARQGQTPGITLLKVEYDPNRHREYVGNLISALLNLCETDHMLSYPSAKDALADFTPFYWGQLERVSYQFKHPDFVDEHEWRLVRWFDLTRPPPPPWTMPEFYRAGHTLTPYTAFQLHSATHPAPSDRALPLRAVRFGPSSLPNETLTALDRMLNSYGYAVELCERRGSDTPVRLGPVAE